MLKGLLGFELTWAVIMVSENPGVHHVGAGTLEIAHGACPAVSHSRKHDDTLGIETSSVVNSSDEYCLKTREKGCVRCTGTRRLVQRFECNYV